MLSRLFCTFLCRCFARLQRETSRNFLATRFMEEMLYAWVPVHFLFPLPHIFTLVAASISPFLTAAMTFSCVSSSLYTKVTFFLFFLFDNRLDESEQEARERKMNIFFFSPPPSPYASALTRAFGGLLRENRKSVNRLVSSNEIGLPFFFFYSFSHYHFLCYPR